MGRVVRVARVIEDRHPHGAARVARVARVAEVAGVVHPRRALAPVLGLVDAAVGVADHAAAGALDRLGNAHGAQTALLGVAERDRAVRRVERDGEIQQARAGGRVPEGQGAQLLQQRRAGGRVVLAPTHPLHDAPERRAAVHRLEAAVRLEAVALRLGPEVHAVHQAVRHPERAVVHVVGVLARHAVLQRPGTRHRDPVRPDHRVQVGAHRMRRVVVVAPARAVDGHLQMRAAVGNPHPAPGTRGLRGAGGRYPRRGTRCHLRLLHAPGGAGRHAHLRRGTRCHLHLLHAPGGQIGQHAPLPVVAPLQRYLPLTTGNAQHRATFCHRAGHRGCVRPRGRHRHRTMHSLVRPRLNLQSAHRPAW